MFERQLTPFTMEMYFERMKSLGYTLSETVEQHAEIVLDKVNTLYLSLGWDDPSVHSGWRSQEYNDEGRRKWLEGLPGGFNAAKFSKHIDGDGIDTGDDDGYKGEYLLANPDVLERHGLYMEHPSTTKGWCHFQTVAPKSGKRIFYP